MKAALTGISGQVGSIYAEYLLGLGYEVYGLKRRASSHNTQRIDHIFDHPRLKLFYGDLADYSSILNFVGDTKPDIFVNLAAPSHVKISFDIPDYTYDTAGIGPLRCLEAIRKASPKTRFLQSSSSEMFGGITFPQNEKTPFYSKSPYATAKIMAYYTTINYREAYSLFAANSICFNMESSKRGENFLTRKVTRGATRIKLGLQDKLVLGNLHACRDWQSVHDSVRAMQLILTADEPDDFVIGTGEMRSVQEFVELVFSKLDLDWKEYVVIDSAYFRPTEVDTLCADSTKIREKLGWTPKYSFEDLVNEMVQEDMKLAQREKLLQNK